MKRMKKVIMVNVNGPEAVNTPDDALHVMLDMREKYGISPEPIGPNDHFHRGYVGLKVEVYRAKDRNAELIWNHVDQTITVYQREGTY